MRRLIKPPPRCLPSERDPQTRVYLLAAGHPGFFCYYFSGNIGNDPLQRPRSLVAFHVSCHTAESKKSSRCKLFASTECTAASLYRSAECAARMPTSRHEPRPRSTILYITDGLPQEVLYLVALVRRPRGAGRFPASDSARLDHERRTRLDGACAQSTRPGSLCLSRSPAFTWSAEHCLVYLGFE